MSRTATAPTAHREVDAFPGHPRVGIDLRRAAPFGWGPATLLGSVAFVDRVDVALMGGALPALQSYFGFNDAVAGVLLGVPSVAALVLVIPAGRIADTRNRRNFLSIVIALWGVLSIGAAFAPTLAAFFLARILLGMATPLNSPAAASLIGDLYRSAARTKAFAISRVLEYLGFPIGLALGGLIAGTLGWRWAFALLGIPALVMAVVVRVALREPRRGVADELDSEARLTETALPAAPPTVAAPTSAPGPGPATEGDTRTSAPPTGPRGIRSVLRVRTLRYLVLGQALLFCGFAGAFSFATLFLSQEFPLASSADRSTAVASVLAGSLGLLGIVIGGIGASRVADRYHDVRKGWRVTVAGACLVVSFGCVALLALVPVLVVALLALLLVNVCNIIALVSLGAVTADVISAAQRGTGFAIASFLVTIGSAFGTIIVGVASSMGGENLRVGYAALLVPLGIGAALVFRARSTYEDDRDLVLATAR